MPDRDALDVMELVIRECRDKWWHRVLAPLFVDLEWELTELPLQRKRQERFRVLYDRDTDEIVAKCRDGVEPDVCLLCPASLKQLERQE